MQVPGFARPDSDSSERSPQEVALVGGDGQPASSGTAVVSNQGIPWLLDPVRQAFETWLAKGTPGRTIDDLWYAFMAGHMFAEVSAAKGHAYALAIMQGEKPLATEALEEGERPASNPRTWQSDLAEDR